MNDGSCFSVKALLVRIDIFDLRSLNSIPG